MSWVERLLCKLFPYRDIPAPDGRLYLRRWFLNSRSVQLWSRTTKALWCLHKICLSDTDRWPHTHPSSFVSIILKNGYEEQLFEITAKYGCLSTGRRDVKPITLLRNPKGHIHRVTLYDGKPCWTLVRLSPPTGEAWGFVQPDGSIAPPPPVDRSLRVVRGSG